MPPSNFIISILTILIALTPPTIQTGDANRLYEDKIANYNKLVRPVSEIGETLVVTFKLKLSQLLDVHEKNQILTTNVWLQHSWTDYNLRWDPAEYGGVDVFYVPSDSIWLPDVVLYNNADGNYQVAIMTKAKVNYNGTVEWSPPAIYKSMCQIDIEFFPFDRQQCEMKFGSWTYGGLEVDLQHRDKHLETEIEEVVEGEDGPMKEIVWVVEEGIDLSDYLPSVEWDILKVPAKRHSKRYPCCESPFIDITYEIHLRRKTLFYTVNLIFPSVAISFLTILVFYLPSNGGEKIPLCIQILISLTFFFLILVEIIPSTSLVIPLIGKYLLFTMIMVTLSVVVTVVTLNIHFRTPTTHTMPKWMKALFIDFLPKYLLMTRPQPPGNHNKQGLSHRVSTFSTGTTHILAQNSAEELPVQSAVESVSFIAEHLKSQEDDEQVIDDWKYISVVMDRILLITFFWACAFGTVVIIARAPSIYDRSVPIA